MKNARKSISFRSPLQETDHELFDSVLGLLQRLRATSSSTRSTATITHCRATRALRDGADEETVVVALLLDIGDTLAPWNHSDLAAAILQPYLSPDNHWLVQHHGIFQGYYFWHHSGGDRFARERYRGHPMFERTAEFCEKWDQRSFDPNYDTLPFDAFEPMMRRLLARPPFGGAAV